METPKVQDTMQSWFLYGGMLFVPLTVCGSKNGKGFLAFWRARRNWNPSEKT